MPDSPLLANPGRLQRLGGTLASLQAGHLIDLILIYIKYTKKCGFDNYAPL